jgi:hypothetical protein
MKKLLIALLIITALSCKKDSDNGRDGYGCVYGKSKTTMLREFIRCGHKEIYKAGSNQTAANTIADQNNLPHEGVSNMVNYTEWEFSPNEKCDCD